MNALQQNQINQAYMYATLIIFSLILSAILFHNTFYYAAILNNKFRTAFISIIYKRISFLNSFAMR
jgi:hypothetical protein